ncbi:hypothetical protein C8A05DRAFT_35258 [Staphylotrichum tortipilum]|uniref:Aminoglycoside phosphotransferase domain-containing protein n=1 Tax=Staphylotrichum tortipilum TaxID=2831512 RepID=A0AAN6MJ13_9PEZI|nr:hypothetical protein C8A05DRAFT_35258 [Staphylotrichum longicolle]
MEHATAGPQPAEPKPAEPEAAEPLHIAAITFVKSSRLDNIVELPFGKILKLHAPANEIAAMEFVQANTTIPVPKNRCQSSIMLLTYAEQPTHLQFPVLDIYERQPDGSGHILMTRIPSTSLDHALPSMTPTQIQSVASEPAGSVSPAPLIGGTTLGPGYDHRLGSHPWGPFPTLSSFHTFKARGGYTVRYTHADLNPRNIVVDAKAGKITGIVDWEFGGWYPEY